MARPIGKTFTLQPRTGTNWFFPQDTPKGTGADDEDFIVILIEVPTTTPLTIIPAPSIPTYPTPSSLPASSLPPQTILPVTGTPAPSRTRPTESFSSTVMSTIARTVAAVVAVVILLLTVWVWRRNIRPNVEGSQFPRSVHTTTNAPYVEAEPSEGNPADEWRFVDPIHGDAPPSYSTVITSGGAPVVCERRPGPAARTAEVIKSTGPAASAGHGHMSEQVSDDDQDQLTPEAHPVETTSSVENPAPLPTLVTVLPPYDPTADQDTRKASESAFKDATGATDGSSSGTSSLHLDISTVEAFMNAASAVASSSNIPGVRETAMLVTLLVKLVDDHSNNDITVDRRVR